MIIYRLSSKKYSNNLSGLGAFIHGGRWNKRGQHAVYASSHISLACLEIVVHLIPGIPVPDLDLVTIEIPNSSILELHTPDLHQNWNTRDGIRKCKELGDSWITEGHDLTLRTPSSIIVQENNYIINPQHDLFKKVKVLNVQDFPLDERLIKSNPSE